jgi:hypothetical protein
MNFPYPRLHFGIRALMFFGILAIVLFLLAVPDANPAWLWAFGAVGFLAIFLVSVTPMFTHHRVTDSAINLRQGLLFSATFRFGEIEAVERLETGIRAFGMLPLGARGRIILANGNRNLVSIKLKARRRFPMLLWKSGREIIIDLVRPDEFVKAAKEKLQR